MNLLIIGATGKTGRELVRQGLNHGHSITVLARNPKKIKTDYPSINVVKGDVMKPETMVKAFKSQDVVISALGHKRVIIKTSILSIGTRNIIQAMNTNNIKRFICITALGINDSRFKLGIYYTFFVIPFIIGFYFLDKSKQEKLIMKSQLDWTIIRPAALTGGKLSKKYKHGLGLGSYIFTRLISRANVAHFSLTQIGNNSYLHKAVGITN